MQLIGDVAKRTGNKIETIRYYEKIGLLPKPRRSESGYRQYSDDAVKRLHFIRTAKALGFTLNDIKELLALRADNSASCAKVQAKAKVKLDDVESKIRWLRKIKKALESMIQDCRVEQDISRCPILKAIDDEEFQL